jgi:hypothetical protein
MILSSKNNNFIVRLNKGFIYPDIAKRYETYLKRLPLPYESVHDYLTASIQAVSFPSLDIETVEQVLYEDPHTSKGGKKFERYLDRSFTITFKTYEGYINYWIMFDLFRKYYDLDNKDQYLPDINLTFMDHTGFEFITINFNQIVFTGLSELELNYSSNSAEFKTFTAKFKYNYINIQKRLT